MSIQFSIQWFDELDSTNTSLVDRARSDPDLPSGTIYVARMQTAGRGRLERKWMSARGQNLLFSLYYRTDANLRHLPSLTMAASIAIDEMLHSLQIQSNLKWPNDVQVNGRKIAGLLSERTRDGMVIGIGLDVNMTGAEAAQIDQPATSILIETGMEMVIEDVLGTLLTHLPLWLRHWEAGGFSGLRDRWLLGCGGVGTPLSVRSGEQRISGLLAGFGEDGELLLRMPDGQVQAIWSGDVNV